MKDAFVLLNNNIRELFRQTSFWIGVIIVLQFLMIWLIIYVYLELSDSNYHFYMNTKTSMEGIHHVKIDKYDGSFERELSTEEKLIRKQNQRWHLRKLFK